MGIETFLLWSAVIALVGGGVYRRFLSPKARVRRALTSTPPRPVRQLAGGKVHVRGKVQRRGDTLAAPLSGRPCVAFDLRVEEAGRGGWQSVLVLRQECPSFIVKDDSGIALVEVDLNAEVTLGADAFGAFHWLEEPDTRTLAALRALLSSKGIPVDGWLGRIKRFRYREETLGEGDVVSVIGPAAREVRPDGEPAGPRAAPSMLVLRGTPEEPLRITDAAPAPRAPLKAARLLPAAVPADSPRPPALTALGDREDGGACDQRS